MDRILVVDDDRLVLQTISRVLRLEGYEVVTHNSATQAADETDFSVVLTDFLMPDMNGIELLAHLKTKRPDAVRLLMTGASDFRIASQAVNHGGIFRLLGKPWTTPDLVISIQQALEHFHLLEQNRRLVQEVEMNHAQLVSINRNLEGLVVERTNGLLDGMISALDHRDTETQWHSRRVALFSRRIAEEAGVAGPVLDVIEQGALLHDIGKIGVRDSILLKAGPLTPEEWDEMKKHPEIGYRMLAKMPYLHEASLIVLQHQERYDGKGYPQGIFGAQIVMGARIFCIADTLDAITSDRPYRKGRSLEVAKAEIARCKGTQFDPHLVEGFLRIQDSEWQKIRDHVEELERTEKSLWTRAPTKQAS